jgi:hypothetical protein
MLVVAPRIYFLVYLRLGRYQLRGLNITEAHKKELG